MPAAVERRPEFDVADALRSMSRRRFPPRSGQTGRDLRPYPVSLGGSPMSNVSTQLAPTSTSSPLAWAERGAPGSRRSSSTKDQATISNPRT